jgi:hypothetical protein
MPSARDRGPRPAPSWFITKPRSRDPRDCAVIDMADTWDHPRRRVSDECTCHGPAPCLDVAGAVGTTIALRAVCRPGTKTGFGGLVIEHRCRTCLAADEATRGNQVEHVRLQVGGVALHEAEQRGPAGALPGQPEEPQAGHRKAAAPVVARHPGLVGD